MKQIEVKCRPGLEYGLSSSCILFSASRSKLSAKPYSRPDSCWSWVVCLCSCLANIIVVGLSYSYGILFPVLLENFKQDRATTAWVGSLFTSSSFLFGPVSSNLCDRYGCRFTAISGAVLCVLGLLLTSQAISIYTMYLSFSVVVGFGCCCVYTACFVIVPRMFDERRSLALGIISLGPGAGIMVMAPVLQCLLDSLGWRKTFLALAGITGIVGVLCSTFDSTKLMDIQESKVSLTHCDQVSEHGFDTSIFSNKKYVILLVTSLFYSLGVTNTQVYLVEFCSLLAISPHDASMLYFYIGLTSSISRVSTGQLCDSPRINKTNVFLVGAIMVGVAVTLLPMSTSYANLMMFALVLGFFDGISGVSLSLSVIMSVTRTQRSFGLGVWLSVCAVSMAVGPPLTGFVADVYDSYSPGFYMSGGFIIISGLSTLLIPAATQGAQHANSCSSSAVEIYIEEDAMVEMMTVV